MGSNDLTVLIFQVQSIRAEHHVHRTDFPAIHALQHSDLPYASVAGGRLGLIGRHSNESLRVHAKVLSLEHLREYSGLISWQRVVIHDS